MSKFFVSSNLASATSALVDFVRECALKPQINKDMQNKRAESGVEECNDVTDYSRPTFIIVPDRFSLQCERMLLRGGVCMLNTRVLTFSMLFHIVYGELNDGECNIIDKTSAVLLMWKAIRECQGELDYFAKVAYQYNFAEKMFNTVNQLTSSLADFDKLEDNANADLTRRKMRNIATIYKHYSALMRKDDALDSNTVLAWLTQNIKNSKVIKQANIYVANFDYISIQRAAVIEQLASHCRCFGASYRENSEFEACLNVIAYELRLDCEIVKVDAPKPVQARVFRVSSVYEEAVYIANEICALVKTKDVRYRDIVVVLADFDNYVKVFCEVFAQCDIAVNVDVGESLEYNPITRMCESLLSGGSLKSLVELSNSPYIELETEESALVENFIIKYGANISMLSGVVHADKFDVATRAALQKFLDRVGSVIEKIAKASTVTAFCDLLIDFVTGIDVQNDDMFEKQTSAKTKMINILEVCRKVLGAQVISVSEFKNVLLTLASATKVSVIPKCSDRVQIVGADEYEPANIPHLFIAGATHGTFPREQSDTDILTEHDIENVSITIEPTASMQNARAMIRAQNIIKSAMSSLVVTHSVMDLEGNRAQLSPAFDGCEKIIADLNGIHCASMAKLEILKAMSSSDALYNNEYYATLIAVCGARDIAVPSLVMRAHNLDNASELFLNRGSARVTQIENFYKCPYFHFLQNGLSLRKREHYKVESNVIGTIIHKFVELFLNTIIERGKTRIYQSEEVSSVASKIFDEVIVMPQFGYFVGSDSGVPIINLLRKEAKRIAISVIEHLRNSEYFPRFTEYKLECSVDDVALRGVIDRIDACMFGDEERAIIIDYKTGSATFSPKNLYHGVQLQLPLYMHMLANRTGMNLGGAYYWPLKGGYKKVGEKTKISGIVLNSPDNISAINHDTRGVSDDVLGAVIAYALQMARDAVQNIREGYIECSPYESKVCEYCLAKGCCGNETDVRKCESSITYSTINDIVTGKISCDSDCEMEGGAHD